MSKKFKFGVFGLACRGNALIDTIANICNQDAEVYAICDKKPKLIEDALKVAPNALAFNNFDDFIECGMDAVILCNYFHQHAPFAIRCLEKGIPVLSECTPAATLRECVELCEAVERTGVKYSLAENYPFGAAQLEMKRIAETGTLGKIVYAEGEYRHPMSPSEQKGLAPEPYHWRNHGSCTYYVTHSLSPLMYMTGTMPKKVNACAIHLNGRQETYGGMNDDISSIMLVTMDNDAVFRIPACAQFACHGNSYRLCGTLGSIETLRNEGDKVELKYMEAPEGYEGHSIYKPTWATNADLAEKAGHGGGDFWVVYDFIEYLNGNKGPEFDVYQSVAISAVGIQAWRSILNNGTAYPIPDFRNVEERNKYKNDNLTPMPDENGYGKTLPSDSRLVEYPDPFFAQ